jgi:hypothetical protein
MNIEGAHLITAMMRYRGGGVGHKSVCKVTRCLLDDRDSLDKVPFTRDSEKNRIAQSSDGEMMEDADSEEEEEATEVADGSGIPFPTEQLIDDDVADEMDGFRYTGLNQINQAMRRLLGLKTAK